ncbi:hypothetical protein [Sphingorhabdus sp. Alg239-R122]|uniref:hypothetical protein n=1 Tax=Sphingorhabdus sp. Alg239-R122 TaxID=2305989 RepID=UPI0013DB1E46|nr:hypothetical protein [Sphingorhabdus sp. Alg239-R122]
MTKPYTPARLEDSAPVTEEFDPFDIHAHGGGGGSAEPPHPHSGPAIASHGASRGIADAAQDMMPSDIAARTSADAGPGFAPVPRKRVSASGWTPQRQQVFIAALADTGLVIEAAADAGMTPRSAYQLRRAPGAESFAKAWDMAIAQASRQLTDIAFARAINGIREPVFDRDGNMCGMKRKINDRLLMFLLRHHRRDIYGVGTESVLSLDERAKAEEWNAGYSPLPEALDALGRPDDAHACAEGEDEEPRGKDYEDDESWDDESRDDESWEKNGWREDFGDSEYGLAELADFVDEFDAEQFDERHIDEKHGIPHDDMDDHVDDDVLPHDDTSNDDTPDSGAA